MNVGTASNPNRLAPSRKPPTSWCAWPHRATTPGPSSIPPAAKAARSVRDPANVFDSCIRPPIAILVIVVNPAGGGVASAVDPVAQLGVEVEGRGGRGVGRLEFEQQRHPRRVGRAGHQA